MILWLWRLTLMSFVFGTGLVTGIEVSNRVSPSGPPVGQPAFVVSEPQGSAESGSRVSESDDSATLLNALLSWFGFLLLTPLLACPLIARALARGSNVLNAILLVLVAAPGVLATVWLKPLDSTALSLTATVLGVFASIAYAYFLLNWVESRIEPIS